MKKKYNDNIKLVRKASHKDILGDNEYFALMVEDYRRKHERPKTDFFDYDSGYVGLECTSEQEVYISTRFSVRYNIHRGITFIVEVKDPSQCCELK